ncbi:MAG TPA: ABC transporter ATP-binding protein, partial [Planctomycetes bacterium]|nr:ABC transporter ATP-binding protein [Planctomycetota bacterium]
MAALEWHEVDKHYPSGTRAVMDFSLRAADGELLVLVGPSGAGKTTLLRLVAGLERPTGGGVLIGGRPVDRLAPHRRGVSMVFERPALYPHLTVAGNLAFPLRMAGVPRVHRDRRVAEMADMVGLGKLLDRPAGQLSGGQQQRVAIGRALVRRPAVCLMDEPLSSLDPPLRAQIRAEIVRLHQRLNMTVVYVTHDQAEAMAIGQRIAVLCQGRLQQVGSASQLYREPCNVFVARFLGSPGMNVFPTRLRRRADGRWAVELGGQLWALPDEVGQRAGDLDRLAQDRLLVGIRPEAVRVVTEAPGGRFFQARVQRVEQRGHESIVYLDYPAGTFAEGFPGELLGWEEARQPPPLAARLPAAH